MALPVHVSLLPGHVTCAHLSDLVHFSLSSSRDAYNDKLHYVIQS